MSSRMSTFSRRRLFSSSSCWFRLRKRCISLRSPVKLTDSGRKERGQSSDCQPTAATSDRSGLSCTLPATQWPFSNLRLWPARFMVGMPYSRPSSTSRVDLSSCREEETTLSVLQKPRAAEAAAPAGTGARHPVLVGAAAAEGRLLSPHTPVPPGAETTGEKLLAQQLRAMGGVVAIPPGAASVLAGTHQVQVGERGAFPGGGLLGAEGAAEERHGVPMAGGVGAHSAGGTRRREGFPPADGFLALPPVGPGLHLKPEPVSSQRGYRRGQNGGLRP